MAEQCAISVRNIEKCNYFINKSSAFNVKISFPLQPPTDFFLPRIARISAKHTIASFSPWRLLPALPIYDASSEAGRLNSRACVVRRRVSIIRTARDRAVFRRKNRWTEIADSFSLSLSFLQRKIPRLTLTDFSLPSGCIWLVCACIVSLKAFSCGQRGDYL